MAEEQSAEQEPSIEEILDSIRQIISDDDDDGEAVAVADDEEGDVIELTDRVDEPEPAEEEAVEVSAQEEVESPKEEVVAEAAPEKKPAKPEEKAAPPKPEIKKSSEVDMAETGTKDKGEFESILSNQAETAAYEGFAELARKTLVEHEGITLEEIVRGELRPLLKDWLDKNLPSMIERMVREELDRIAKRAMGD